jgi:DNA repair exonuclease SbcCD nuclease subunit
LTTLIERLKTVHLSDLHAGFSANTVHIHDEFFNKNQEDINSSDVVIVAGDEISHSQHQYNTLFRTMRKYIPNLPILIVSGNHSFWDYNRNKKWILSYSDLIEKQKEYRKEFNIHHLEYDGPVELKGVKIWGFNGWYGKACPQTNDHLHMRSFWATELGGVRPNDYLTKKAYDEFDKILADSEGYTGKKVIVTHFPPMTFVTQDDKWWMMQMLWTARTEEIPGIIFNLRNYEYGLNTHDDHGGIRSFRDPISDNFDYCLMGHFHGYYRKDIGRCSFRTTGCNYDLPFLNIIDI